MTSQGDGYSFTGGTNNIDLKTLTGNGTGGVANLTLSGEKIASISIATDGEGYSVGDVLTIDNDDSQVLRGAGAKFTVRTISSSLDTLYLTDVQGDKFTNSEVLVHYNTNNNNRTVANATVTADSTLISPLFSGKVFEVYQYNHAHHGAQNKILIENVNLILKKVKIHC
ncbi:MAG: hypothetical protein CM15mP113_2260 [Pseudomonadota bacterium]|nr:MAG: hypothetical protein CM15mP113_2260 [Pseudomonadota bacterium]